MGAVSTAARTQVIIDSFVYWPTSKINARRLIESGAIDKEPDVPRQRSLLRIQAQNWNLKDDRDTTS